MYTENKSVLVMSSNIYLILNPMIKDCQIFKAYSAAIYLQICLPVTIDNHKIGKPIESAVFRFYKITLKCFSFLWVYWYNKQ